MHHLFQKIRGHLVLALSLGLATLVIVPSATLAANPAEPICTIIGTELDDFLTGTSVDDVICGLGGNDEISGLDGDDVIIGGGGDDVISGGNGSDQLRGDEGNDSITGGEGEDYSEGGPGADKLFGGDGRDALIGGIGDDALVGGEANDSLDGGDGIDYCDRDKTDTSITSCFFDRSGPRLVSVAISTKNIDTSTDNAIVIMRARIVDKGTGLKSGSLDFSPKNTPRSDWGGSYGISSVACEGSEAPNPDLRSPVTGCRVSGDLLDGIYEVKIIIPKFTPKGRYVLSAVNLEDTAGNNSAISGTVLVSKKLAVSFNQVGAGDTSKPKIVAFQLLTKSVNTNTGNGIINLRLRVTDNQSGISSVHGAFGSKFSSVRFEAGIGNGQNLTCDNKSAPDPKLGERSSFCLESGSELDATFNVKIFLPQYSPRAIYNLDYVHVKDNVQNVFSTLNKKPWNRISFKQVGAGDSRMPKISQISVVTPTVNTSTSQQTATIRVQVADKTSGISKLEMMFAPDGVKNFMFFTFDANNQKCNERRDAALPLGACLISGTLNKGVIELSSSLPAHSPSGSYFLQQVLIEDKANNGAGCGRLSCHESEIITSFSIRRIQITNTGN